LWCVLQRSQTIRLRETPRRNGSAKSDQIHSAGWWIAMVILL